MKTKKSFAASAASYPSSWAKRLFWAGLGDSLSQRPSGDKRDHRVMRLKNFKNEFFKRRIGVISLLWQGVESVTTPESCPLAPATDSIRWRFTMERQGEAILFFRRESSKIRPSHVMSKYMSVLVLIRVLGCLCSNSSKLLLWSGRRRRALTIPNRMGALLAAKQVFILSTAPLCCLPCVTGGLIPLSLGVLVALIFVGVVTIAT
jgi:hypothetical protein